MKPTGHWVAAPMNIHRINWIWGSTKAMEKAGITSLPKTWAEFNADCDKAIAAHLICIAHFSQDWTDATTFEVVVYGQDIDLFRKAFVEGDTEAMRSPEMVKAFEQLRLMVSKYMDPAIAGRDYDTRHRHDRQGPGCLHDHGRLADRHVHRRRTEGGPHDYVCAQAPTDWGKPGFILNSDSVVFFKQKDPDYVEGQKLLAHLIMSPEFQTIFNQAKGSIPARLDVDLSQGLQSLPAAVAEGPAGLDRGRHAGALDGAQHDGPAEVSRRDDGRHHLLREHTEDDRRRTPPTRWRTRSKRRSKRQDAGPRGASAARRPSVHRD